ncbi:hypothetical protein Franean1_0646 [Parafrankia sp. EAN1pec]|uniref:Rho termination factor N-terminal domain-containing protein n=1 Tax=Parafrankia sp. (strain EAN1pec) TaxID=298653 RepID=UPI000054470C|nr:hypothetical protein Franean1_0646 [Frankia sp. EAN1pec]
MARGTKSRKSSRNGGSAKRAKTARMRTDVPSTVARSDDKALSDPLPTAEGVDEKASVKHLREIARQLDIPGRSTMNKADLIEAVRKANRRATAAARG